ncbi:protein masquerade-like [Ixodes scapularis]|uniref:protein masquerade-like n=1 Tax=Ixodes scapularis TaxID=6945 RepID=UPI001A9E0988|nr:protein masquerade-like [Ixodes scapularis]
MRPQLLPFLAAVLLSLCWTSAEHKDVFLETDRSYKYDLPSPGKPGANSNCTGKCVHVFMGLLCDFVDDNADCGEQFLRCCVGGIFSRGFTRKSGTSVDMMDDSPTEQQIPNDVTTPSPSNDDHPVADPPPPKEPKPTQPTSPEKENADQEPLTAMESLQSPQIESPLPEPAESTRGNSCPGSCVMPLLGLLCGTISRNHSCSEGRVCCATSTAQSEDTVEATTVDPVLDSTTRTPVTRSACHGRCIPMYLSNTCKRPSVILISKSVSCSSGMICCSRGLEGHSKYGTKTEVEHIDQEDSGGANPSSETSTEAKKLAPPPRDEQRPRPIAIPIHRSRPQGYPKPTRPLRKPFSKQPSVKPPDYHENNYNYYGSTNEEDESSQEHSQTRRPPYYIKIRHPSLGPPVLPTPPYHDAGSRPDVPSKFSDKQDIDNKFGRPPTTELRNLSATVTVPRRPPQSSGRRPPPLIQATAGSAVGEVFPVRVPLPSSDYDEEHRSWLQRVHELAKKRAPPRPQEPGYSQQGGNKRRKPNWQHSIKPHESEFGNPWNMPIPSDGKDIHHFSASTSNSGWIPFHQAYQPVNKQKVAENHHNNSSEFTPMRGVFQNPNQEPRDPNVCGVRGVKNRTNHPQSQGGTEARPGEWCWHAAIVNRKNQYICNGALISAQWVLTAADCVLNHTNATENIYVRLGYTDIMSPYNPPGAQTKTVAKAYVHHSFNKDTLANNIALLKLKDIVELNGAVCVVCLPHKQKLALEQRSENEDCVATGYGSSAKEDDLTYNYPRLKEASVAVLRYSDGCPTTEPRARQLELAMDVTGSYFCAGHGDVEEDCRGDPGRLLVCPNGDYFEISGIASQGLSCGGPDALALYTNVSSYSGWINQIANVNRF